MNRQGVLGTIDQIVLIPRGLDGKRLRYRDLIN